MDVGVRTPRFAAAAGHWEYRSSYHKSGIELQAEKQNRQDACGTYQATYNSRGNFARRIRLFKD
jgi:hypothetical protein